MSERLISNFKYEMLNIYKQISNNYLSNLNTLTKLIISLFFSVFIIFLTDKSALLFLFAFSFIYVLTLKKIKIMLFFYLIISIMFGMSLFFSFLLGLAIKNMGGHGNFIMLVPFLRIGIMINFSTALILSSKTKKLVNVLKTLHTPRVLFLPILVIFRFVLLFARDMKQIHESIKIRFGTFNFLTIILKPLLFIRLMIAPTVIRALRSADELAAAAELKGISDTKKITNSSPEIFRFRDAITLITAGTVAYICLLLNIL